MPDDIDSSACLEGPKTPRYLVDFHPKGQSHFFTDVLIIGGGLAGLRAANAISDGVQAVVVTKDQLQESNSNYAQGGIASVWDPEDCFEDHVRDTLAAGGNLCHDDVVDMVVRDAPQRVSELIREKANCCWAARVGTVTSVLSMLWGMRLARRSCAR